MSGGGGGGSTTTSGPPSWQLPYIKEGMAGAQTQYNAGGIPVVPFSQETEDALSATATRARAGNPGVTAAQNVNTQTINGGFLGSNPYLDATFNRAALQTQNQLASQFAGSGRNIDASMGLRSQQLNDLATGIYGGAYDAERNRQQQAIGAASGLANQDYTDLGQLAGVGAQREGLAQDIANQPSQALDQYLSRVTGGGGTSTYTPSNRNRFAGAIGGGMLGSQIGGQVSGGSTWGQGLGALLGAYGGGWG
jgi:hypothetical protein